MLLYQIGLSATLQLAQRGAGDGIHIFGICGAGGGHAR
jgi:hypothetical protein